MFAEIPLRACDGRHTETFGSQEPASRCTRDSAADRNSHKTAARLRDLSAGRAGRGGRKGNRGRLNGRPHRHRSHAGLHAQRDHELLSHDFADPDRRPSRYLCITTLGGMSAHAADRVECYGYDARPQSSRPRKAALTLYRQYHGANPGRCGSWCIPVSAERIGAAVRRSGVGLFTLVRQRSVRGIKRP
jgi:hypothetical protein